MAQAAFLSMVAGFLLCAAALAVAIVIRRDLRVRAERIGALRREIAALREAASERDRAEAASSAKSRFLATVSHEIRTPLNGILGLAHLLEMTALDSEQASYVEAIGGCGRSLAQLIDDILDLSKIEAGKATLRLEEFDVAALIESVVELLAPRAHEKNLEISSCLAPGSPTRLTTDASRLRQILINLVGNAVDFTEQGGVGLRVCFLPEERCFRFETQDTGVGVSEAAKEKIFNDFEQGDASASSTRSGAGLGLAISRSLARALGGELSLTRSDPAGSTFTLTLPIMGRDPAEETLHAKLSPTIRLLIVASSVFEAPFLAEILRGAGAEAALIADPSLACQELQKASRPYQGVIVDCALGIDAAGQVAKLAHEAGAKCLLLFSPRERRAIHDELSFFDGWLVKPVRAASLRRRLLDFAPSQAEGEIVDDHAELSGLRILLCEDNEINALIITRRFASLSTQVVRAQNGDDALRHFQDAARGATPPFDAIIMDLFMPNCSGVEASRKIRAHEFAQGARRTPILALTASALGSDMTAAKRSGVDVVLTKPADFDVICRTIRQFLAQTPGNRVAAIDERTAADKDQAPRRKDQEIAERLTL